MKQQGIRQLLAEVQAGDLSVDDAMEQLRELPAKDLEFAVVDHHRTLRCGFPEVIFSQGKTVEQIVAIAREIAKAGSPVLATRASAEQAAALLEALPDGIYHELGRAFVWQPPDGTAPESAGKAPIAVVTAGTSDLPIAEEAAITAKLMGNEVIRISDVGVAGIHRLVPHVAQLNKCGVIVVIAGMEGALASVIGGLVDRPIIAVPTSIGYGASFGGIAALLGMLNSCAAGVLVTNIDNGFGAGYAAARINGEPPRDR